MNNLIHTVYQGEGGKIIDFSPLEDADGSVDLTAYTVTMTLEKGTTVTLNAASVTKKTQSGATLGGCYHTWTTAETAALSLGEHLGNLKCVAGSTVLYFPCDKNGERTYFKVNVLNPKG